jgi:hypothetical protein
VSFASKDLVLLYENKKEIFGIELIVIFQKSEKPNPFIRNTLGHVQTWLIMSGHGGPSKVITLKGF